MSDKKRGRRLIALAFFLIFLYLFITLAPSVTRLIYPIHHGEIIAEHARNYNLEPQLVAAVIRVESSFKSEAESAKGARGLMQIMPETGAWAAEQVGMHDYDGEKLFDPHVNITLGTWYLHHLYQTFDTNPYAALAAYNGGRGHVKRWLDEGIWDGSRENLNDIPFPETRNFVSRVEAAYRRYHQLYDKQDFNAQSGSGRSHHSWETWGSLYIQSRPSAAAVLYQYD